MTLESRPIIRTLEEMGVSYLPLTHKAFFGIVGRFRDITYYSNANDAWDSLGYFEITGVLDNGKPTYDLFLKESQLPKQKATTLTHEIVHIFWEEDILDYKSRRPGRTDYGEGQPLNADISDIVFGVGQVHEDKVEAEAKRFFRADHGMVLDTYRQMCLARDLHV